MIDVGILSEPENGEYKVEWPEINSPSKQERLTNAKMELDAYNAYIGGANQVLTFDQFLVGLLGKTQDEADAIMNAVAEQNEDLAAQNPDESVPASPGAPKPAPKMVPQEGAPEGPAAKGKEVVPPAKK
jgi:hypothetical protein